MDCTSSLLYSLYSRGYCCEGTTTAAAADDADDSFPQNSSSAEDSDEDRRPGRLLGKMQHLMLIFPPKNCQFEVHCTAFTQGFSHLPRAQFVHKVYFHRPQPPPSSLSLRLCKVLLTCQCHIYLFVCCLVAI